jgi:adenine-specific DNA-methyltransferase
MAKKKTRKKTEVQDYRHSQAKRKNNPPAKIAAEGVVPPVPKAKYEYNPHLPPVLRFDQHGGPDKLPPLLAKATKGPLTKDEARLLAEALARQEPWLEWTGKREAKAFEVDPVALHIHERVSAHAILHVAAREDVQRSLFGDPQQAYHEAVQFYRHDVDWTNRMILGDSLQVMSSLARRENLAGKVQMIYMDPPYGIKFASNFQPEVGKRDVRENQADLTREPEMVKAYRDTWNLGTHSYLSYLRDRLVAAKELLADSGSLFVQISDENLHRVRCLLDDVFGPDNFCACIAFVKTAGQTSELLASVTDHLLWYARSRASIRFNRLFQMKIAEGQSLDKAYNLVEMTNGYRRRQTPEEMLHEDALPRSARLFQAITVISQSIGRPRGEGAACCFPVCVDGRDFRPTGGGRWRTNEQGMARLHQAERLTPAGDTLRQVRYMDDFPAFPITSLWRDTGGGLGDVKLYSVQTALKVVERCMLMTTDPGDLVLDPTCGSGTTACVAEQWGRRWITIDTSRVAIAIARQRILTAKFDRFRVKGENEGGNGNGDDVPGVSPHPGFVYKTVPHVTLKSIAQNTALDPIFAKHEPILAERLAACNAALGKVSKALRQELETKLAAKERKEGKKAVTDADRRRWALPKSAKWEHWEVPFDTDADWPQALQDAVTAYRKAWRAKMDEVNACIAASAEQEELVDQPEVVRGVVRVSGPFTVEAVQPPEMTIGETAVVDAGAGEGKFDGEPEELEGTFEGGAGGKTTQVTVVEPFADTQNIPAYLDKMIRLIRGDGVRFPNNKEMAFSRLDPVFTENTAGLHAEGRWTQRGQDDKDADGPAQVAVVFGPQYGPVTALQVEDAVRAASRRGYTDIVFAGFSFDGPAQAVIEEAQHPKLRIHMAHIRPDVNPGMDGLLKEQPGSQLFTVFGQPRTRLEGPDGDGQYVVHMEGVDIYSPVDNTVTPTSADKVAAWFLDSDYDGRCFCITQAFFPDRSAWKKLAKALKGVVDEDRFEALSGTKSLPFPAGKFKRVAVKVIDPRGNEVMRVHRLDKTRGDERGQ